MEQNVMIDGIWTDHRAWYREATYDIALPTISGVPIAANISGLRAT